MRIWSIAVLATSIAACHGAAVPCTRACDDGCPDGMTCSTGFCAAPGEACEPTFEHVAAGTGFGCALDSLQRLWCWGSNAHHQIEDSDRPHVDRAVMVGDQRWDTISLGGGDICALASGELWCWGSNNRNQIAPGLPLEVTEPTKIDVPGGPRTWSVVAAAFGHTCAIGEGRLFCWGAGTGGVLGTGTVDDAAPSEVDPRVTDWTTVATSTSHTCAASRTRGVSCWGDGSNGELGNGRFEVEYTPQATGLTDVTSLAAGLETTCATTGAGALVCWGRAAAGALGDPAVVDPLGEDHAKPVPASSLTGWTRVVAAERYACGLRGPDVWCWGSASTGGIGDGRWAPTRAWARVATRATDLAVGWNATFLDRGIDTGDLDLSCAVADAKIACWGDARAGQLGRGGATFEPRPVAIAGEHTWSAITAGPAHVCGVADGVAHCWGSTERGQIGGVATGRATACMAGLPCDAGEPTPVTPDATALALGGGHSCALRGDALTCWGDSTSGQCGTVSPIGQPPVDVPGAWSRVFAGANGTCGVRGGETWCWGKVLTQHVPAHEPALDGARAIALGAASSCLLDATGELACFGDNARAAFGNGGAGACGDGACNARETAATCARDCGPGPLTHLGRTYTAIALGATGGFGCGLRSDRRVECWGDNDQGQAGEPDPDFLVTDPVTTPFLMPVLTDCTAIAAGTAHACAVCHGEIDCWGDNEHGQLGAGDPTRLPVTVPRAADIAVASDPFVEVAAGATFTCGRTQAGRGFCWGSSPHGALGTGPTAANLPVFVEHE